MNDHKKLGQLIRDLGVAMLTTVEADGSLRSRPMAVPRNDRLNGHLHFVTALDSAKVEEVFEHRQVNVSLADTEGGRFVSISGKASIDRDPERVADLWDPTVERWFPDGSDGENLAVLIVTISHASYWEDGRMVALDAGSEELPKGNREEYPDRGDTGDAEAGRRHELDAAAEKEGRPEILHPLEESPD